MQEIILATGNNGKITELKEMLTPYTCISQEALNIPEAEETGTTFIENALIKARNASFFAKRPALADDSGLVVPALNGEPGIFSARYAGKNSNAQENINLLLERMQDIEIRDAYFYCVIVLVRHAKDPSPLFAVGKIEGMIAHQPQGIHGFGYDPIFCVKKYACTMAELERSLKNKISHRGKALTDLKKQLTTFLNVVA
jgi:XTP/dITP diphosphohydrolase